MKGSAAVGVKGSPEMALGGRFYGRNNIHKIMILKESWMMIWPDLWPQGQANDIGRA